MYYLKMLFRIEGENNFIPVDFYVFL